VIDSLGSGGAQRLFINIVNGLAASNSATVFLYKANSDFFQNELLPEVSVHYLEACTKTGFSFEVLKAIKLRMDEADVVISFLPTANIYCAIASIFSHQTRHIACEMSIVNEAESTIRRLLANLANYLSGRVICNSFTQYSYICKLPGMANKVSAIWNGCADRSFVLRRPQTSPHSLSLIVVGRVAYPKNGVRLLQALQMFYERNGFMPYVTWVGRDDTDKRSQIMKQQMLDFLQLHAAVNERFQFIGEMSDLSKLYADADALVLPSIYEGLPVVICEAMLSGCPVVATKISDNEKILGSKEERGFLCNPLSPEDICKALERRSATSAEKLECMTNDARRFAEEHFSVLKMVDGYRQVIKALNH
jgi:glycosyltransferase involved in cell wall biosynthesis